MVNIIDIGIIKAAIFDVDGTLLDSMPIWKRIAADYLISCGATPRPDLQNKLIKLGGHEMPEYFRSEYGIRESAEEIQSGIYKLLEEFYFNRAALKDGIVSVLEALRSKDVRMCVATATDRGLIEAALRRCGIIGYFGRIFTCREEETSKSSPDIYLRAADFLGTAVGETLVVEDAPYAIRTAKEAGFPVVAVYDLSAAGRQEEIRALCDYYAKSFDGLLRMLQGAEGSA